MLLLPGEAILFPELRQNSPLASVAYNPVAVGKGPMTLMPYECDHAGLPDSPEFLICHPTATLCQLCAVPRPGAQIVTFRPGAVSGDTAMCTSEQASWESVSTGPCCGSVLTRGQGGEACFICFTAGGRDTCSFFFFFYRWGVG